VEDTDLNWRKSRYSNGGENACLETASDAGEILVRDTTNRAGAALTFSAGAWGRFAASLR
jgi:Domain of unknown function (DUF397)